MPTIHDEAVCVRHWDWSETSQTVSLFTRAHGLLRAVAKGARRPKGAFSGGIELLARGDLVAITKASGAMATLTAWDLSETFPALRRSYRHFNTGLCFADLVLHSVDDSDPHPELYTALIDALRGLDAEPIGPVLVRFQWAVLVQTGAKPELAAPGPEPRPGPDGARLYGFDPDAGGVVADPGASGADPDQHGVWRVRAETIELLRRVEAGDSIQDATPTALNRANRLLAAYLRARIGREPPTLRHLFESS